MDVSIIVNYYNSKEFLDLIESFDENFKVTIYNKSNEKIGNLKKNYVEVETENIGREGHTYLTHIIENYDNLSDINVFIQDDFYNHLFNIEYFESNFQKNKNDDFYQFPCSWRKGLDAKPFSRTIVNGYLDLGQTKNHDIKKVSEMLNVSLPNVYTTETCAHFLISKKNILRYKKEFYKKLLDWLLLDDVNGYTLEHTWKILFM